MLKHVSISNKFIMAMGSVALVSACAAVFSGSVINAVNNKYEHLLQIDATTYSGNVRAGGGNWDL